MAPLPASSTTRFKYTYQNAENEHSIVFRVVSTTPTADVDTILQTMMSNIGLQCMASTITLCEKAEIGSDIFNPVSDSSLVGDSFGSGAGNKQIDSTSISFVGRGSDARRSRIFLFGYSSIDTNWRILASEDTRVNSVLTELNEIATPLLTIGGTAPIWKAYANVKPNDHWVKKAR